MAYSQISIDTSKQWGNQTRRFRNQLLETRNIGRELLGKATAAVDGSNYTQLESQFGLETGKGAAFYGELNSLVGKLDNDASQTNVAAAIAQFINLIG
jgi:hypothetical protein